MRPSLAGGKPASGGTPWRCPGRVTESASSLQDYRDRGVRAATPCSRCGNSRLTTARRSPRSESQYNHDPRWGSQCPHHQGQLGHSPNRSEDPKSGWLIARYNENSQPYRWTIRRRNLACANVSAENRIGLVDSHDQLGIARHEAIILNYPAV
jgi:hypothetical protein